MTVVLQYFIQETPTRSMTDKVNGYGVNAPRSLDLTRICGLLCGRELTKTESYTCVRVCPLSVGEACTPYHMAPDLNKRRALMAVQVYPWPASCTRSQTQFCTFCIHGYD